MATNMTTEAKPDIKVQVARFTAREKIKAFNVEGVAEKITRPMQSSPRKRIGSRAGKTASSCHVKFQAP